MKLPRLLPFRRAKQKSAPPAPEAQALAQARERALEQMRARRATPEETALPQAAAPLVEPAAPPAPAGDGGEERTTPQAAAEREDPLAAAEAAVAEANAAPTGEELDPDLLDIFRDAKQEAEEGSLASEVEEVSIQDLLSELRGVSQRLGVKVSPRRAPEPERVSFKVPDPETPEGSAEGTEAEVEELPKVIQVPQRVETGDPEPIDLLGMPPEPVAESEEEGEEQLAAARPESPVGAESPQGDQPAQQASSAAKGAAQRYILHGLFLILSLALAAGFGIRGAATGAIAGEYDLRPTPAVLAYMQPPLMPETVAIAGETPAPTPTPPPTASPTPLPTPSPTPVPTLPAIKTPAYFLYTVQYGDSLSSIAAANDICPDHILWNNPGRKEEDQLLVGDKLLLPGVKGVVHRVQPGDTLSSIAARYSARPEKMVAVVANHLGPGQDPTPGSRILVPDGIPPSALLRDERSQEMTHTPSPWGYVWPFFGPVTTYYGEERPGYTHLAVDIGGLGSYGAPVGAAAAGQVVKTVHDDAALGNFVAIQHEDGSRTIYAHLSETYVSVGEKVEQAEPVGALGCTGHSTGTHLHFELWIAGYPVDPLDYLP